MSFLSSVCIPSIRCCLVASIVSTTATRPSPKTPSQNARTASLEAVTEEEREANRSRRRQKGKRKRGSPTNKTGGFGHAHLLPELGVPERAVKEGVEIFHHPGRKNNVTRSEAVKAPRRRRKKKKPTKQDPTITTKNWGGKGREWC